MFNKSQEATSKVVVPKWKYVVTILMLLIAGVILGIYSSIERQLEKSFHQMWLEEEIPYPVESEYTMLTATSMVGYGLYAIGLDQSSLLYQPLHYLNRIAYESAMKKIPEDDSIREWFYYYRYYAVPILKEDRWVEGHTEDLLEIIDHVLSQHSQGDRFLHKERYEIILNIFSYLIKFNKVIKDKQLFSQLNNILEKSEESFLKTNPDGKKHKKDFIGAIKIFPLSVYLSQFHWIVIRDGDAYRRCDTEAYQRFIKVYKKIYQGYEQKTIKLSAEEEQQVEAMLFSKKKLRNALAESAWVVCHINLDAMEEAYDKNRRRYQY